MIEKSKYSAADIYRLVDEEDVEFIRLQFVDIFGTLKNIAVTRRQLDLVLAGKIVLEDNTENWNFSGEEKRLLLVPDLDTFVIFPWRPQTGKVARLMCHICNSNGEPFAGDSRNILRQAVVKANKMGYNMIVSPECEFFLFDCDEHGNPTTETDESAGFMDVSPLDTGENARRDTILTLEEMGFDIRASYHEKAAGQHQLNLSAADATYIADEIETFKMVAKIIAKRHGKHATFLPKPRTDVLGSGMHLGVMLLDEDGRNLLADDNDPHGLSKLGYSFMAGIVEHAGAISAITNPLVNSYKRLVSGFKAPVYKAWSFGNEESIIMVNRTGWGERQIELSFPDATSNPYLALTVCLMAGLDGIEKKLEAPAFLSDSDKGLNRDELAARGIDRLPDNLGQAIEALKADSFIIEALGKEISENFINRKTNEWRTYLKQVTSWEIDEYLYRY